MWRQHGWSVVADFVVSFAGWKTCSPFLRAGRRTRSGCERTRPFGNSVSHRRTPRPLLRAIILCNHHFRRSGLPRSIFTLTPQLHSSPWGDSQLPFLYNYHWIAHNDTVSTSVNTDGHVEARSCNTSQPTIPSESLSNNGPIPDVTLKPASFLFASQRACKTLQYITSKLYRTLKVPFLSYQRGHVEAIMQYYMCLVPFTSKLAMANEPIIV